MKKLKVSKAIRFLKLVLFFVVISTFSFQLYNLARHAHGQALVRAFTVSPPTVEAEIEPGGKAEGTLKIINDSPDPITFGTSMQDFIVKDNVGTPEILPPDTLSNKYSGAKWVAIYPSTVTVEPRQSQQLNYFIQVPSDARPGGRYAAIVYTPVSTIGVEGTGAAVQTSVGTLFYITVKGPVAESASVTKFSAPGLIEGGPISINTQITNKSDIHINPEATIKLTNFLGGSAGEASLPRYNIFPEAVREFNNTLGQGFMLGPYTATLTGTYGSANLPLAAALTFWVIPWRLIIFVILLIVAIAVGTWYLRRRSSPPPSSL